MRYVLICQLLLLSVLTAISQNDYTCFSEVRQKVDSLWNIPRPKKLIGKDSVFAQPDYVSIRSEINNSIGCTMPDFSFFNVQDQEITLSKLSSEYTLVFFSFIDCGEICNDYITQFADLRTTMGDSLTVILIYKEPNDRVTAFSKDFTGNLEFVANADILTKYYSMGGNQPVFYLMNKRRRILMVEAAINSRNTYRVLYDKLRTKITESNCY
jgi:peroxiredoxin